MKNRTVRARRAVAGIAFAILGVVGPAARAELRELVIHRREPFARGATFGDAGPYEKIVGVARFAVDPGHVRNRDIVDVFLAPRNAAGKVEFDSDVCILAPKDPARGNGAILYDVNNRGNKLALRFFNAAPGGNDPTDFAAAGDGFLLRRGYTKQGQVRVVKAGPAFELLSVNTLDDYIMATPAISNGCLFVRSQHFLVALGRKPEGQAK